MIHKRYRQLSFESLEERRLLAILSIGSGTSVIQANVDGYGSFGTAIGGSNSGDVSVGGPGTTFHSGMALGVGTASRQILSEGTSITDGAPLTVAPVTVVGGGSIGNSSFQLTGLTGDLSALNGLNVQLSQTLSSMTGSGVTVGGLLTQAYILTNPTVSSKTFDIVRYIDADIENSNSPDWGGRLDIGSGEWMVTAGNDVLPNDTDLFVAIATSDTNIDPLHRFETDSYNTLLTDARGGILPDNIVHASSNGPATADQWIGTDESNETGYDITHSLRNVVTLASGASWTYKTYTVFGNGPIQQMLESVSGVVTETLRVTDVTANATTWTRGAYSYSALVPLGKQLVPIATEGINLLQVKFNRAIDPIGIAGKVRLYGSNSFTNLSGLISIPTPTVAGSTVTIALPTSLGPDKYRIEIDDTLTDLGGRRLDAEWDNLPGTDGAGITTWDVFTDDPVGRVFRPGDGVAGIKSNPTTPTGGKFRFFFSALPGDGNGNGLVSKGVTDNMADVDGDGLPASSDTTDQNRINIVLENSHLPGRNRVGVPPFASGTPPILKPVTPTKFVGDYVDDDRVDNIDYFQWRGDFGIANRLRSDGTSDGIVDARDYNFWRDYQGLQTAWNLTAASASLGIPVDFGAAPRVTDVTIRGSASVHAPFSFSSIVDGSGEQLQTVPVGGADTISIKFSEDVFVTWGALKVRGLWYGNQPAIIDMQYDVATQTATWRLSGWTPGDNFVISLDPTLVVDIQSNHLDGEWLNPRTRSVTAGASQFPSGNGVAGGAFNFVATLLSGDASLDGIVNVVDLGIFSSNYGFLTGMTFNLGDFTGNGGVDFGDFQYLSSNYGLNLTTLRLLGDLNNDWRLDQADYDILAANLAANLTNPTAAQGNLDGDGDIDSIDLAILFNRLGLELSVVG